MDKNQKKLQLWLPLLFALVMIVGMIIGYKLRKDTVGNEAFLSNSNNTTITQVLSLINKNYVDNVNTDSLQTLTINNLLARLDPHSTYIPANQLSMINDESKGIFTGIGIGYELINDSIYITNVTPHSPAAKSGIEVGDIFLSLNDSLIISGPSKTNDGVVILLRALNNPIKIKIYRNGKIFDTKITKSQLPIPSIDAAYMLDTKTAYVRISTFSETTYRELMLALEKLKQEGMQQLIIDLRGNSGGILTAATQIVNEFLLDNQLIVYTDGAKVGRKDYRCKRDGLYPDLKLEILIDETSASASEVIAGALQDWDRATIIGRRSFGKGLVENQFKLNNGAALRLTVARYYTPLGRNIQKPYKLELATRFHNGETMYGDTTSPKGKAYKTPKGNIVYSGGGITPNIYVAYDSSILPKPAAELYLKGTLLKFSFLYFLYHLNDIKNISTTTALANYAKPSDSLWNSLVEFAKKDTIDLTQIDAKAKDDILEKFQAFVSKYRFGSQGYFEINNQGDDMIQEALEEINKTDK